MNHRWIERKKGIKLYGGIRYHSVSLEFIMCLMVSGYLLIFTASGRFFHFSFSPSIIPKGSGFNLSFGFWDQTSSCLHAAPTNPLSAAGETRQ